MSGITGRPFDNLPGRQFERLTVLSRDSAIGLTKNVRWACRCTCGKTTTVTASNLRNGITRSCGCIKQERMRRDFVKHGRYGTPEYVSWIAAKGRCYNTANKHYKDYGGRGISMCDRWMQSFEHFLADMGLKPSRQHSIDRINNDGPYAPENCRWATPSEQAANQRKRRRRIKACAESTPAVQQ